MRLLNFFSIKSKFQIPSIFLVKIPTLLKKLSKFTHKFGYYKLNILSRRRLWVRDFTHVVESNFSP
jgi:hypothetical protein